jgi:hypothetical protein
VTKLQSVLLCGLLVSMISGPGSAQERTATSTGAALFNHGEPGFFEESKASEHKPKLLGGAALKETSREKIFYWDPMSIPSGRPEWAFSQRVSGLKVSVIEQKGVGDGKIQTFYVASGTLFNLTEDDKTHIATVWTIDLLDAAGAKIDSFRFSLSHDHCSYHGEEPFNTQQILSAFNFFDVTKGALASGLKPAGYQGGC